MDSKQRTLTKRLPRRFHQSPNVPMSAIRRYVRRIVDLFHPEKIILFGSYAYGAPDQDSDVDLLVVMTARNEIDQAVKICVALPAPFARDLIVRTPNRLHWDPDDVDWFLREIVEKGKVLYEKKNRAMGAKGRSRLRNGAVARPRKSPLS
jgi:predicted nucleotidyltransferase